MTVISRGMNEMERRAAQHSGGSPPNLTLTPFEAEVARLQSENEIYQQRLFETIAQVDDLAVENAELRKNALTRDEFAEVYDVLSDCTISAPLRARLELMWRPEQDR